MEFPPTGPRSGLFALARQCSRRASFVSRSMPDRALFRDDNLSCTALAGLSSQVKRGGGGRGKGACAEHIQFYAKARARLLRFPQCAKLRSRLVITLCWPYRAAETSRGRRAGGVG